MISVWIYATDFFPNKKNFVERFGNKKNLFKNAKAKEVFVKLKSAGVDGIELLIPKNFSDSDFAFIKNIFDENKIPVNSIHQPLRLFTKTDFKEVEMLFKFANKFNAKVIVLHLYSAKEQIYDQQYLDTLHKLQKDYGIKIGFENTQKFGHIFSNKKIFWKIEDFLEIIKKSGFSITLDTTHLADAGGDIIEFFKQSKENIINIQLSDYKFKWPVPGLHLPLGKGKLPIKEFLKVLKASNYDGLITMEIKTDLEGLCDSARFIRQYLS